jgi:hypothetical protein
MMPQVCIGDVVRLKKVHPCGSYEWKVLRVGSDVSLKCCQCGRRVVLERGEFERRVASVARGGNGSRK